MAEQEVIKHGKRIYKIWNKKEVSFIDKLKEFFIEIFIITFAITLSLALHNWSEHKNEQKEAKAFLLGLKSDLQADISSTKKEINDYKHFVKMYTFLSNLTNKTVQDKDTLHKYIQDTNYTTFLRAHTTRFNGFLSAGKIMTIENHDLSFLILNYYQETLPMVESSESGWMYIYKELNSYLLNNVQNFDDDNEIIKVLATSKGRYLTKTLIPWQQLFERYNNVIKNAEQIIAHIDKMYPDSVNLQSNSPDLQSVSSK